MDGHLWLSLALMMTSDVCQIVIMAYTLISLIRGIILFLFMLYTFLEVHGPLEFFVIQFYHCLEERNIQR